MNYIIEANLGIILLYAVYLVLLGKENDFPKQRAVLLIGLACALVFPLVTITPTDATAVLTTVLLPEIVISPVQSPAPNLFLIAYCVIAFLVAVPFIIYSIKIYRLSKSESGKYKGDYYIIESSEDKPSWSFFNLIYIGRAAELSEEDKDLVVKHEMVHGKLLHSIDMLLITVLCILFWFNPVLWFYRQTIAKLHEFEVDSIIARQNGPAGYSELLAKTALSRNGFLLTHHFNQSFILKRINMINMIKSRISNWKLAGLATVVTTYFVMIACTEPMAQNQAAEKAQAIDKSGEIFNVVAESASPTDGMTEFFAQISNVLVYPEQARKMGIEGKVFVEFIVNKGGEISDIKVVKGIGAGCDQAAIDAMKQMKSWNPAKHEGVAVRQKLVLPITFKMG